MSFTENGKTYMAQCDICGVKLNTGIPLTDKTMGAGVKAANLLMSVKKLGWAYTKTSYGEAIHFHACNGSNCKRDWMLDFFYDNVKKKVRER